LLPEGLLLQKAHPGAPAEQDRARRGRGNAGVTRPGTQMENTPRHEDSPIRALLRQTARIGLDLLRRKKPTSPAEFGTESAASPSSPTSGPTSQGGRTVYEIFPDIDKIRVPEQFPDIKEPFFWETYEKCKAYSLLGIETFYNLYRSVEYVAQNKVAGDFVECGVFLGGSVLATSDFAHHFGLRDRRFHIYDTFEGFPDNTWELDWHGTKVPFTKHANFLECVRKAVTRSLCPADRFEFVAGMVEETLPRHKPGAIALLRLDTDYYESTRAELEHLYPLLSPGGVLIIDDYGLFQGARRATDEFFAHQDKGILLMRVNASVRCGVKIL